MFGNSAPKIRNKARFTLIIVLLASNRLFADNRLSLKKVSDNAIVVELANTDPIAGFQFSINARGGIALQAFEGIERTIGARLAVYQYLKDGSTLNVVLLAPFPSSLSSGQGGIGKVSFVLPSSGLADSARVFLTNVEICNADTKILNVTAEQLAWSLRQSNENASSIFDLVQNYPNPFNPSTTIAYRLLKPAQVTLVIFDVTGRQVKSLVSQYQLGGQYSVNWNADNNGGSKLASGMYFARLQVDGQVAIKKMIFTK